jgi:two-component system chemotaxis response regulator CheY
MSTRILVVDDSALARRMIRQILESGGYEVEEATDGAQALERYFLNRHDIVFLDNVMDRMYGLEVLMKFRELNPDVRVIMATADVQTSTKEEAKAAGASAYITKPFNREKVLQLVSSILTEGSAWN